LNANRVRIIGGGFRSRILRFPSRPGLRPSPDRVRETLFNWLGQDLTGKDCLDLFAGSGALGLEAASRNAHRVVLIENDPAAHRALAENVRLLNCGGNVVLRRIDALEFVRHTEDCFDVIFLDPPFGSGLLDALAPALPKLVRPHGVIYVESAGGTGLTSPWQLYRRGKAGHVTFQLFTHGDQ
jgi:16S rRNA (guanine966-N2)-methyltransferase